MVPAPLIQLVQQNFGIFTIDKLLTMYPQPSTNLATGGFLETIVNFMDKQHQGHPLVSNVGEIINIGGNIFGTLQGRSFKVSEATNSQDIQVTIDLMHRSSKTKTDHSHDQPVIV